MLIHWRSLMLLRNLKSAITLGKYLFKYQNIKNCSYLHFHFYVLNTSRFYFATPICMRCTSNQVCAAESVDEILSLVDRTEVSPEQAANAIITLNEKVIATNELENIYNNSKFKKLCQLLSNNLQFLFGDSLVLLYTSLILLKIPPSDPFFKILQKEILFKLRKFKISNLVNLLNLEIKNQTSDLHKEIFHKLISLIFNRYIQITLAEDILQVIKCMKFFPKEFVSRLENRSLELVPCLTPNDFQNIIISFTNHQHVPNSLLKALTILLNKQKVNLSIQNIVGLLLSLNRTNYCNHILYEQLFIQLVSKFTQVEDSSQITIIAESLEKLKWRYPKLITLLSQWLIDHLDSCPVYHFKQFVLLCGSTNFWPDNAESLIKRITVNLLEEIHDDNLLDVIWSLAVLEILPQEMAVCVIEPDFYMKIIDDRNKRIKLLNIIAEATLQFPDFSDYNITKKMFSVTDDILLNKDKELLQLNILNGLRNLIPNQKLISTSVPTPMGYTLDAEFLITKDLKQVQYVNYQFNEKPEDGIYRIALLIWRPDDFTQCTIELIGSNAMAVRHLTKLGYHVMQVSEMEYEANKSPAKKMQYLEKKLKSAIEKM